ncbi:recombinase family protein [Clostridium polynesiense]|uniref:recombinase family protein n=1 Tax=Clostridium polynesiense TaxID=1325933 RepID=UPI0005909E59|nr:recombinase family protein [Clostridium polynesiense]
MSRWFYYLRISTTKKQKLDRQLENQNLESFCQRMGLNKDQLIVMEEKKTGKNFDRPNYKLLKEVVNAGDNIIVASVDRFGRNYIEGRKEFAELLAAGVKVYVLNRPMLEELYKLNNNMSKFMINFLVDWELITAEEDLNKIKERQREGIEAAQAKGRHLGRKATEFPDNFEAEYESWKAGDQTAVQTMNNLDLKPNTFYRMVKKWENKK